MSTSNCPVEYAEMIHNSGIDESCISGVYECEDCGEDYAERDSPSRWVTRFYARPEFIPKPGWVMPTFAMVHKRYVVNVCPGCVESCDLCGEFIDTYNDAVYGYGVTFDGKSHHAWCAGSVMVARHLGEDGVDLDDFTKEEIAAIVGGAK